MLLTVQQREILNMLRKLGCVRTDQLLVLVRKNFPKVSERGLDAMLRQLRTGRNDVRLEGELVRLSGTPPSRLCLEAIDVMLELAEGAPEDFTARVERPALLRFALGKDWRLFTVVELSVGRFPVGLSEHEKSGRVVWISESGVVPDGLRLPPGQFFAARQPDGSHRFYGSNGPS